MPRNTFLVVTILAVFAALVVGVNIGKRLSNAPPPAGGSTSTAIPTPALTPTPTTAPPITYISKTCGVSFDYPPNFTKQEASGSSGVIFTDPDVKTMIIFTCQKDIPRPPLAPGNIETIQIASMSAKLYHDTNAKDGTPIDKLIFRHPKNGLDVFFAGLGPLFQQAISSLKIL